MKYICIKIINGMIMRFDFYNFEFFKYVLLWYIIKGLMYLWFKFMFRNVYIMVVYRKKFWILRFVWRFGVNRLWNFLYELKKIVILWFFFVLLFCNSSDGKYLLFI